MALTDLIRILSDFLSGGDPTFAPRFPSNFGLSFFLTMVQDAINGGDPYCLYSNSEFITRSTCLFSLLWTLARDILVGMVGAP